MKTKCRTCGGHKVVHGTDDLTVEVEAGMDNGQEIVFPRAGDQSKDIDVTPGDIIYRITTTPHARFTRRGDDLYISVPLSLKEAIGGFSKKFKVGAASRLFWGEHVCDRAFGGFQIFL